LTGSGTTATVIDIRVGTTTNSIFGTNKLQIDIGNTTSVASSTQATWTPGSVVADDTPIYYYITSAGTNAVGLKATIYFLRN